jgi:hypothetical protein
MDGNNSPASHGCRTPTKKAKRPPNYGGYHEEHSDGLNHLKKNFYSNPSFFF